MFFDGERTGDDVTMGGTSVYWVTLDMTCAATLREQLTALLGEPAAESILPKLAGETIAQFVPWPGMVKLDPDE